MFVFRQHCKKILKKIPLYSQQFLRTIFLVIDNFFSKIYTLHSKLNPFSFYFSFFVSVYAFFHVFLKLKIKKFSSDY